MRKEANIGKGYWRYLKICADKYRKGEFEEIEDSERGWQCFYCRESIKGVCINIRLGYGVSRFHKNCLESMAI